MTPSPRHSGPAVARSDLGPELVDLGPLRRAEGGRALLALFAALVALLLLVLGAVLVLLILGVWRGEVALVAAGVGVGVVGVLVLAPLLALAHVTLGSSLVIHEDGFVAHQGVRAPLVIPWWEVGELVPQRHATRSASFRLRLRTGRWIGIARLKVDPRLDADGRAVPHPDVAVVLEHYSSWCRRHGRPVAIRW